jgi:hypothetical protein
MRHKSLLYGPAVAVPILVVVMAMLTFIGFETHYITLTKLNFPVYMEQEFTVLSHNTTIVAYNITIPENPDPGNQSIFGISALTNMGYRFDVGVVTNPVTNNTMIPGAGITIYESAPNGLNRTEYAKVYDQGGISYGNKVLVRIYTISNSTIVYIKDWDKPNVTKSIVFTGTGSYLTTPVGNGFTGPISEYSYYVPNTTVSHPVVIYQPVNYYPQNVELGLDVGRISPGPSVLIYDMPLYTISNGHLGNLTWKTYSEYYYQNGTFVTK